MIDMLYPDTGWSVVAILEHLGVQVDFPMAQTCCAQPAYNSGHRPEAKQVAIQFLKAFKDAQVILTPSGSCGAMVRHEYPTLFEDDPQWAGAARHAASITWEFTEFITEGLGITDLNLRLSTPESFAVHDACHGLRLLNLGAPGRKLLGSVQNLELVELPEADVCCGFGGLFSVKMSDVSGAMLQRKIDNIEAAPAPTIITGDVSCLTHMNGGLSRQSKAKRVRHIADVLAEGLPKSEAKQL
jgi:L-lactate dehydrogenase complex protein LldE